MEDNKVVVVVREFNEEKDRELVIKLEKSCNNINVMASKKGTFSFTTILDDPLCRVRLYPVHVMLVAELGKEGEVVGIVRGCIKCVNLGRCTFNLGCILGLRVSPLYRRLGIGLKLVQSIEEWLIRNGASCTFLAIEENNIASTNLFSLKCNYIKFTALIVYVQPLPRFPASKNPIDYQNIKIDKLSVEEAISFYKSHLKSNDMYPTDIESIVKEKLSLGTWICYFKDQRKQNWTVFSIWSTCEPYKPTNCSSSSSSSSPLSLSSLKDFFEAMDSVREKFVKCIKELKRAMWDPVDSPVGFLLLYGVYGEGERRKEVMEAVWRFGLKLGESVRECSALITEMGVFDPMVEFVPKDSNSMICIQDLWWLKRIGGGNEDNLTVNLEDIGNVFVDPRDF